MTSILSVVAVAAVIVLSLTIWLRTGRRWKTAVVETLRITLVVAAVIILWRPETMKPVLPVEPAAVVVLIDQSDSMQTPDAFTPSTVSSRRNAARTWIESPAWRELDVRFARVVETFDNPPTRGSDLAAAIRNARRKHPDAAAIVLVSDGDWHGKESPIEAVASLNSPAGPETKLFTVPLGSADRLPDLELIQADVPVFAVIDQAVRIPFSIANWFDRQREVAVQMRIDGRTVERQTFVLAAASRHDADFTWQPSEAGEFEVEVVVEAIAAESIAANNRVTKPIQVRRETLRVLIVESQPRWEYRYLRNALIRDPGVEVSSLLLQPGLDGVGGGGEDYLDALPEQAAEWAAYDVIFLGDVGVGEQQLTVQQCGTIAGLVRQQAVGLVLMPGRLGHQQRLLDTELGELFPVVVDRSQPRGVGGATEGSLSLTQAGRRSRLTELVDEDQANWAAWEALPGFYWHAAVQRAKAGSEILAVHSSRSNESGRLPLLVTRPAGAGKVLFMGSDAAWRWRRGVEDKFHYRFWGQVIRWMAYQRNMAVGQTMRLSYQPEKLVQGDTVFFRASVMTSAGTPADAAAITLNLTAPDSHNQTVRLSREDQQWGVYTGQVQLQKPGQYELLLSHPNDTSQLRATLAVQGRAVERIGMPARPDIMRELARVGGGAAFSPTQVSPLVQQFNASPQAPARFRRIQWWNHPLVMAGMLAGLTLFWIARKWAGTL